MTEEIKAALKDNGDQLRELIEQSGLTQNTALERFNHGQGRPMALRTLKTYLAHHGSKTRIACPDSVLVHMKEVCKTSK